MRNSWNHLQWFVNACYRAEIPLSLIAENDYQLKNNLSGNRIIEIINHSFLLLFIYQAILFAYGNAHNPIYLSM